MLIRDFMSKDTQYVQADTRPKEAAEAIERLDTGFLPTGNPENGRLLGVVTGRVITAQD